MNLNELSAIAKAMVAPGKGILAIDESHGTIGKRFASVNTENNEDNRRAYRQMLLTAPNLGQYISGAILFDETIRQSTNDGTKFTEIMAKSGILPGIKVDKGAHPLAGFDGEKVTEGLDGLRDRLQEYHSLGAKFAKWRAVITINDEAPTSTCIEANAHALARYAALCQESNIVPIVEPEVLMDGSHDIEECFDVTEHTLRSLFGALFEQCVMLEGVILKASMVISGSKCPEQANVETVAMETVKCLKNSVPATLPGIVFLSGGQSEELASNHLNKMNQLFPQKPWPLSFSYGRALQASALQTWAANPNDVAAAQEKLLARAKANSLAALGKG